MKGRKIFALIMALTMEVNMLFTSGLTVSAEEGKQTNVRNNTEANLLNDLSVEGTNSLGDMLSEKFAAKAEEMEEEAETGFLISGIEVEGMESTVSLDAVEDCTLVVAVYDEAGEEMLAVGSTEVEAGSREAAVTIETDEMPEYFYLKGYLIDTESLRPLCSVYESPLYTREMQEFLAKTTEDFDEDKVLNLDDDITSNFLVCGEDVQMLSGDEKTNRIISVDEENYTYVIEDADSAVTSLKTGDLFVYPYAEGEILIGKVAEITVQGTKAAIVWEETSMEEVFEHVRIDGESYVQDAEIDEDSIGEGFTYEGLSEDPEEQTYSLNGPAVGGVQGENAGDFWEGEYEDTDHEEVSFDFSFELKGKSKESEDGKAGVQVNITGGINLGIDASVKLYWSVWNLYAFLELKLDYSGTMELGIEGSLGLEKYNIAEMKFPVVPGFVNIVLTPKLVLEASVKLSASFTISGTVGFQAEARASLSFLGWDVEVTKKNITTTPVVTAKMEIEASLFVGIALTPSIELVDDSVAEVGLEATVGGEVTGKMTIAEVSTKKDEIHECKACIDGDITAKWDLKVTGSFLKKWTDKATFEITLFGKEKHIADFYYSFDYEEFALTTCPHYLYRVVVRVVNRGERPVEGVTVREADGTAHITDNKGMVILWQPGGSYRVAAEKGNAKKEKRYSIEDKAVKLTISLSIGLSSTALPSSMIMENVRSVSLQTSYSAASVSDLKNPEGTSAVEEKEAASRTASEKNFSGLKPGAVYNFYVMRSRSVEHMFAADNLFYITQAVADSEGNLSVTYTSKQSSDYAAAFVVCAEQNNIAEAQIEVKDAYYNRQEQFVEVSVTYGGQVLEEGKDYEISGSFAAEEVGTYSVTIKGIGIYAGSKTAAWNVQYRYGDADGDDSVNAADALEILKYVAELIELDENAWKCANVNADNAVDAADALDILKKVAELIDKFEVET